MARNRANIPPMIAKYLAALVALTLGPCRGFIISLANRTEEAFRHESAVDMASAVTPIPMSPFKPGPAYLLSM